MKWYNVVYSVEGSEFNRGRVLEAENEVIAEAEVRKLAAEDNETVLKISSINVVCKDEVNHPSHYCKGGIECIDVIEAATSDLKGMEAVCTANIIKYIFRWKDKNGITDVKKCKWYCEKLIQELENVHDG